MKKNTYLGLVLLLISNLCFAQNSFPKSWIGNYEGNLEIYAVDSIGMQVKMKLGIHSTEKDSVYQWIITYDFRGKEDIRSYELKLVDSQKGHYQIDEKNSIVIDSFYRNMTITSFFEVNKSVIISSYRKEGDSIEFEIIASEVDPISKTGKEIIDGEEIPEVLSYPVTGKQRCKLKKII